MSDPLLTRLQASDPSTTIDTDAAARDARILARVLTAPPPRRARRRARLALVAAACALAALALALGVGRERSGDNSFNAAAATYHALTRSAGLYHFVSVSRMTSTPRGAARGYSVPAMFPPVHFDQAGAPQYHEVWLTPGGANVRWLAYRQPGGPLLHAFAFRQNPAMQGMPSVGPPSDPATAFNQAYKDGRVRSQGRVMLDGRSLWRFVSRKTGAGSYQEWLVDPDTRLPVRYRYVDHNQDAGVKYTTRLTIRLTRFEALPLNADTRKLLHLTPSQRRMCLAAERREIARTRAYLRARGRRVPPNVRRLLRACR